jgi:hypothetical protein
LNRLSHEVIYQQARHRWEEGIYPGNGENMGFNTGEIMGKNWKKPAPESGPEGVRWISHDLNHRRWWNIMCFGHETLGLYPWIDNRDSLVMFCSKNGEWFPIYGHNRTWAFLRHSHGVEGPT